MGARAFFLSFMAGLLPTSRRASAIGEGHREAQHETCQVA